VVPRGDSAKDAKLLVLRHENAVLRRQITGPVRYEPADRFWFAALSCAARKVVVAGQECCPTGL
jgi:hypothetical protein